MAACTTCRSDVAESGLGAAAMTLVTCRGCHQAHRIANARGGITLEPAIPPKPLPDLIQRGSVMEGVLGQIEDSIERLPTIPVATQRVISAIHDPITTSQDLARIIHEDATLSMRVLRLANSAVFSGREPIADLRLACARLGMRNIASVAHLVAHSQVYKSNNPVFGELMDQLWLHAVATARLVDTMGPVLSGLPVNLLFLSGLVHDIGKPVLLDVITNHYKGRTGELKNSWDLLLRTIDEFSPYVGLRVAEHWDLAPEIRFAIFYANLPGGAPRLHRQHAFLIALASATAEAKGYGVVGDTTEHTRKLDDLIAAFAAEASERAAEQLAEEAANRIVDYVDAVAK
jgi:HD-like signal output (HDOD) protein